MLKKDKGGAGWNFTLQKEGKSSIRKKWPTHAKGYVKYFKHAEDKKNAERN